jgi:hypothetical protein
MRGGEEVVGGRQNYLDERETRVRRGRLVPGGWVARYKCHPHLYHGVFRPGTMWFVSGGDTPWYKCETFLPGLAPTWYKCGLTIAYRDLLLPTRYKYPHLYQGQKYPVQMKNRPRDKCLILQ